MEHPDKFAQLVAHSTATRLLVTELAATLARDQPQPCAWVHRLRQTLLLEAAQAERLLGEHGFDVAGPIHASLADLLDDIDAAAQRPIGGR